MGKVLLSLAIFLSLPVIYMQMPAPVVPVAQAGRTERVRAVASFPVAPAVSAPAAVAAAPAPSKAAPAPVVKVAEPAPKAAAPAPTSATFKQEVEQEILRLINKERSGEGLGTLAADSKLSAIARAHSKDMLDHDYFSHTNTVGCGSSCRITAAGYSWRAVGENIYTMSGFDLSAKETARKMVDAWMNSPGHRANILNATYTNQGIALAISGKTIYATSLFSLPL